MTLLIIACASMLIIFFVGMCIFVSPAASTPQVIHMVQWFLYGSLAILSLCQVLIFHPPKKKSGSTSTTNKIGTQLRTIKSDTRFDENVEEEEEQYSRNPN